MDADTVSAASRRRRPARAQARGKAKEVTAFRHVASSRDACIVSRCCRAAAPCGSSWRPQRSFDIDTETGTQVASPLRPETYLYGCPEVSSDGRELLYESVDEAGAHQILYSHSPDGEGGRVLTKGVNPSGSQTPKISCLIST